MTFRPLTLGKLPTMLHSSSIAFAFRLFLFSLLSAITTTPLCSSCLCDGYHWVNFGYRQDTVAWCAQAPKFLLPQIDTNREEWEKVMYWQGTLFGSQSNAWGLYARWKGQYAGAYKGGFQRELFGRPTCDSCPTRLFRGSLSRSRNYDIGAGLGYQFDFCLFGSRWLIAPVIGGAVHEQRLRRGKVRIICDEFHHLYEPLKLLCRKRFYRTRWWGAYYGGDVIWECGRWWVFSASGEYYPSMRFRGREDVKDKRSNRHLITQQKSSANGWLAEIAAHWAFRCDWLANIAVSGGRFCADRGRVSNQLSPLGSKQSSCYCLEENTRLNEAFWHTFCLSLGFDYRY